MGSFSDQELALRMRDAVKQFAAQQVGVPHPVGQLARIVEIKLGELKATAWYPGDDAPVEVNLLTHLIPIAVDADDTVNTADSSFGAGALVWIEHINGQQYVTAVLSGLTYSIIAPDIWHEMDPMLNSWVNYGSGFTTAAYRKTTENTVMLKGIIKDGSVTSNIYQLPVGYRPGGVDNLLFGSISNNAIGRVNITFDGIIYSTAPNSNAFLSLDGISFYAES